jgi:hypothetical protein
MAATTEVSPDLGEFAEIIDDVSEENYPNTLSMRL